MANGRSSIDRAILVSLRYIRAGLWALAGVIFIVLAAVVYNFSTITYGSVHEQIMALCLVVGLILLGIAAYRASGASFDMEEKEEDEEDREEDEQGISTVESPPSS